MQLLFSVVVENVSCCAFTSLKSDSPNNTKQEDDDNSNNIKAEIQASTIM
jgi:hypothetical protein